MYNLFFKGRHYGEMCSNAAKSFNSWVWEVRNLPITRMIDSIRTKLMWQMAKRRVASQTWTGTICPKIESHLEKAFNKGRLWKVSQSNADVYEVHSFPSINGFPCVHVMVAVRKSGRDLNTLVEPYFHVSEYRLTYATSFSPIPTVEQTPFNPHDYIINPPVVKRPLGRPKKKRILSKGGMCSESDTSDVDAWGTTTGKHAMNPFNYMTTISHVLNNTLATYMHCRSDT
ncbi:hypothetical protein ACSBR2_021501 [Camellia fascicularis]